MNATGVGRSFIYAEIKAGRLIIRKAGRRSLVFDDDLKAWLGSLPEARAKGRSPPQPPKKAKRREREPAPLPIHDGSPYGQAEGTIKC